MIIREALESDIKQMQTVRNAVKENRLSSPDVVADEDYKVYLTGRGKGWVCEVDLQVVGFSIADLQECNIWALFVHPDFEGRGIGRRLHNIMLNWYFSQTSQDVWLGTAPRTRAEAFYRRSGWMETGMHGKGEIKFEMTAVKWKTNNS